MPSSPLSRESVNIQPQNTIRNGTSNNTVANSMSALSSPLTSAAKNDGTVALVKSGSEIVKTTPADEYCQQALLSLIEKVPINDSVHHVVTKILSTCVKLSQKLMTRSL